MERTIEFYDRFKKEHIYLWEDFNEVYVRSEPGGGYFAKFPGKKEYAIAAGTNIVTYAVDCGKEVTKEEYENA